MWTVVRERMAESVMCLSGVTCLHVDSGWQNQNNVSEWSYMSTCGQF